MSLNKLVKQQGLGVVAVIAAIAVVAIIGFVGWRFYDTNQQPQQTGANQTTQQPQSDPNTGYIVIKEWGVRFRPVDGLKGVIYVLGSQTAFSEENATFTTSALAAYGDACAGKVNGETPLGWLTRTKTVKQERYDQSGSFVKKIDDYYYEYRTPQSACSFRDDAATKLQTELINPLFKPSIKTLEAAK